MITLFGAMGGEHSSEVPCGCLWCYTVSCLYFLIVFFGYNICYLDIIGMHILL